MLFVVIYYEVKINVLLLLKALINQYSNVKILILDIANNMPDNINEFESY